MELPSSGASGWLTPPFSPERALLFLTGLTLPGSFQVHLA